MKRMFDQKKYKRALVIGAGSGRDLASAVLLTEGLRKNGAKVDLAGFLTPWAMHSSNGSLEKPINRLSRNSRKFIPTKEDVSLGSFFEPSLIDLNEELDLGLANIYLFSLHHGLNELATNLQDLIKREGYDLILAADIGGDILAQRQDLPSLMSPIVDTACMSLLSRMHTFADMQLAVVSPGVDGEISNRRLNEILKNLEHIGCFLQCFSFCDSQEYEKFSEVNMQINLRTNSYSHTFEMIRKILGQNRNTSVEMTYKKDLVIGNTTWSIPFPVELETDLMDKIFFFNLRSMLKTGYVDALQYTSVMEAFLELKRRGAGGTEVDFSYVPLNVGNGAYDEPIFVLVPPTLVQGELRAEILSNGLIYVVEGRIRKALIMKRDFASIPDELVYGEDSDFFVIGK
jgi:hypothetical protein